MLIRCIMRRMQGKRRWQSFWKKLYKISLKGMNIGQGSEVNESGELYAITYLKEKVFSADDTVVFDVGANHGQWTSNILKILDNSTVHCFEPSKKTFEELLDSLGEDPRVRFNNLGLSDISGIQKLYYDKEGSGMASLYKRNLDCFSISFDLSEEVSIGTLDEYCEGANVEHIDYLKIDAEGNELNVLNGAKRMLDEGRIKTIQIEFGGCNIDSRTYFRDFYNLLKPNYKIYRMLIDGLWPIDTYEETIEIFTCTNYIFIHN